MDDVLLLQQHQASNHLSREATNERQRKSLEVVRTNELVEVNGEAWRDDAKMRAEVERGRDGESGVGLVGILGK